MAAEYTADTKFAGTEKPIEGGGNYLVWKKDKGGQKRRPLSRRIGGRNIPHFRHETYSGAVREAQRLCAIFPESTFVIIQELATVKIRETVAASEKEAA